MQLQLEERSANMIDFRTEPALYRHWKLTFEGPVATLAMMVDENGGLFPGYELKLNSYDLGVDIELNDAVQRLRFEHPDVRSVILKSGRDRVFCAGANIKMLATSSHQFKVNFCKFTNETRNAIEDATNNSGQFYLTAINGACAGGGYELALATDYLIMADDGSTNVSLPELPLLAVLPGTGGLTRLVDKRRVRRDHADFFCTTEEGVKGKRAVDWRLVDEIVPRTKLNEVVASRAADLARRSDRPVDQAGIELKRLARNIDSTHITYEHVSVELDPDQSTATITLNGPRQAPPSDIEGIRALGSNFWPFAMARELED
ncbi:MAG: boxC, partial [Candidatus Binatus sp.]|nr:boxC [Candidatus Binatus sp.]